MVVGLLTGFLVATASLAPQELHPDSVRPAVADRWRAGGWPDRVVLTPGADPAQEMAVAWRTDLRQTTARAELALDEGGPDIEEAARRIEGESIGLSTPLGDALYHQVRFTDLTPDTAYAYRLRGADGWGEWRGFRTASAEVRPFRFLYLGDLQNDVLEVGARVVRQAQRIAPDAALVIHAGDLVQQRDGDPHDAEWGEWIAGGGAMLASVPQLPAAGNHEYLEARAVDGDTAYTRLGPHWPAQFALPDNGAPGAEATSYTVDYQGARFIVLDTTSALDFGTMEAQRDWLRAALDGAGGRWKVVVMHHPVFSCGRNYESSRIRSNLRPVLEAHGADLVLQGHDHCYSRVSDPDAGPIGAERSRELRGPVYVVSIAGGKMYRLNPQSAVQADVRIGDMQLFQVVDVSPDRLSFRTLDASGEGQDGFDLERVEGRRILIDRRADTTVSD